MAHKHSDVDRSHAVVAKLDQLIRCLKSRINTKAWKEKVPDEDHAIDRVNESNDLVDEHNLVEPRDDYTPAAEHIDVG